LSVLKYVFGDDNNACGVVKTSWVGSSDGSKIVPLIHSKQDIVRGEITYPVRVILVGSEGFIRASEGNGIWERGKSIVVADAVNSRISFFFKDGRSEGLEGDGSKRNAVGKSTSTNGDEGGGESDGCKRCTIQKSCASDGSDGLGNSNGCEGCAVVESSAANGSNGSGDSDGCERGTVGKGQSVNSDEGSGEGDGCKRCTIQKSCASNGSDGLGDGNGYKG
jgi:hypothetical protein